MISVMNAGYPRFYVHALISLLQDRVLSHVLGQPNIRAMLHTAAGQENGRGKDQGNKLQNEWAVTLFATLDGAGACKAFIGRHCSAANLSILVIRLDGTCESSTSQQADPVFQCLYSVVYPHQARKCARRFWVR